MENGAQTASGSLQRVELEKIHEIEKNGAMAEQMCGISGHCRETCAMAGQFRAMAAHCRGI